MTLPDCTKTAAMARKQPDLTEALANGQRRARPGGPATSALARSDEPSFRAASNLARSHAEFCPGQPTLHERVLQRLDHLLAVGVARAEPATARRGRVLRFCHHRHLPRA
jgi:hypothetical protein